MQRLRSLAGRMAVVAITGGAVLLLWTRMFLDPGSTVAQNNGNLTFWLVAGGTLLALAIERAR